MRGWRRLGGVALAIGWLAVTLAGCDADGSGSPFRNLGKRGDSAPAPAR